MVKVVASGTVGGFHSLNVVEEGGWWVLLMVGGQSYGKWVATYFTDTSYLYYIIKVEFTSIFCTNWMLKLVK